jgi:hypothetical protein
MMRWRDPENISISLISSSLLWMSLVKLMKMSKLKPMLSELLCTSKLSRKREEGRRGVGGWEGGRN